jgi:hypothetical protein
VLHMLQCQATPLHTKSWDVTTRCVPSKEMFLYQNNCSTFRLCLTAQPRFSYVHNAMLTNRPCFSQVGKHIARIGALEDTVADTEAAAAAVRSKLEANDAVRAVPKEPLLLLWSDHDRFAIEIR